MRKANEGIFKAMADGNRRKIVQLLRKKELSAGEIASHFNISKPSISEHLKILKNAGLIESEKRGQFMIYFLNTSVLEDLISYFLNILNKGDDNE